jgi:hypothetical protein
MITSDYILDKLNKYFNNISIESHNKIIGDNGYQYFATPIDFIVNALNLIKEREIEFLNKKFLDVGSGIGNICGVAELMGLHAEGIELNPVLFNISKQIYPKIKFHNLDICKFDDYNDYDIIFYFLPIADSESQLNLRKKIEDNIRIGTYIILYEEENQFYGKDDRFLDIPYVSNINGFDNRLWLKIKE